MNLGGTVHVNKAGCCIILGTLLILFIYLLNKHDTSSKSITKQVNLRKLLEAAIKVAKNGGLEVVAVKDNIKIKSKGKTKEGANDGVTNADFRSHCVMVGALKHLYPGLVIMSEEAKTKCDTNEKLDLVISEYEEVTNLGDEWVNNEDITVWIDPLDATQEYTEKMYEFVTTMVCVAVKGKPIIGVIHNPFLPETAWAWVTKGVSSNLKQKTQVPSSDFVRFIVSRSHTGAAHEIIAKVFKGKSYNIISAAGAGYKSLQVATGKADVYIHVTAIKKWDICAGNAILNALGGKLTTKYNGIINYADTYEKVNDDGLIATLKNHEMYINKF